MAELNEIRTCFVAPLGGADAEIGAVPRGIAAGITQTTSLVTAGARTVTSATGAMAGLVVGLPFIAHKAVVRHNSAAAGKLIDAWMDACAGNDWAAADTAREKAAKAIGVSPSVLEHMRAMPMENASSLVRARIAKALKRAKVGSHNYAFLMRRIPEDTSPEKRAHVIRNLSREANEAELKRDFRQFFPQTVRRSSYYTSYFFEPSSYVDVDPEDSAFHTRRRDLIAALELLRARITPSVKFIDVHDELLQNAGSSTETIRRVLVGTRVVQDTSHCIAISDKITSGLRLSQVLLMVHGAIKLAPTTDQPVLLNKLRAALANCIQKDARVSSTQICENLLAVLVGTYGGVRLNLAAAQALQMMDAGILSLAQLTQLPDTGFLIKAYADNRPELAAKLKENGYILIPNCLHYSSERAIVESLGDMVAHVPTAELQEAIPKAAGWLREALIPALLKNGATEACMRACIANSRYEYVHVAHERLGDVMEAAASSDPTRQQLARILLLNESGTTRWLSNPWDGGSHWTKLAWDPAVAERLQAWNVDIEIQLRYALAGESDENTSGAKTFANQLKQGNVGVSSLADRVGFTLRNDLIGDAAAWHHAAALMLEQKDMTFWSTAPWRALGGNQNVLQAVGLHPVIAFGHQETASDDFMHACQAALSAGSIDIVKNVIQHQPLSFWLPEDAALPALALDAVRELERHGLDPIVVATYVVNNRGDGPHASDALRDAITNLVMSTRKGDATWAARVIGAGDLLYWSGATWGEGVGAGDKRTASALAEAGLHPLLVAVHQGLGTGDGSVDLSKSAAKSMVALLESAAKGESPWAESLVRTTLTPMHLAWTTALASAPYDKDVGDTLQAWGADPMLSLYYRFGHQPSGNVAKALAAFAALSKGQVDGAVALATALSAGARSSGGNEVAFVEAFLGTHEAFALDTVAWGDLPGSGDAASANALARFGLHPLLASRYALGSATFSQAFIQTLAAAATGDERTQDIARAIVNAEAPAFWLNWAQAQGDTFAAALLPALERLGLSPAVATFLSCADEATPALVDAMHNLATQGDNGLVLATAILDATSADFWLNAIRNDASSVRQSALSLTRQGLPPIASMVIGAEPAPTVAFAKALSSLAKDGTGPDQAEASKVAYARAAITRANTHAENWDSYFFANLSEATAQRLRAWGVPPSILYPDVRIDRKTMAVPPALMDPYFQAPWNSSFQFIGELGTDAGGPKKEWLMGTLPRWFHPDHGLVEACSDASMVYPHPDAVSTLGRDAVRFGGRALGLALRMQVPSGVQIAPALFAQMQGAKEDLVLLKGIDETRASALRNLKDKPELFATSEFYFVVDSTNPNSDAEIELIPNGRNERVSPERVAEYVDLQVKLYFDERREAFNAFTQGMREIAPQYDFATAKPEATTALLRGNAIIDCDDFEKHLRMTSSIFNTQQLQETKSLFMEAFRQLDDLERLAVVKYITAMRGAPASGWKAKPVKLIVMNEDANYVAAYTCSNEMAIPRHSKLEGMLNDLKDCARDNGTFSAS